MYIYTYLHVYTGYSLSAQQAGLPEGPVQRPNTMFMSKPITLALTPDGIKVPEVRLNTGNIQCC